MFNRRQMRNKDDYYKPLLDRPRHQAEFSKPTQIKILIVFTLLIFGGLFWSFYHYQQNIVEKVELKPERLDIYYAYRKNKLMMINYADIDKINLKCGKMNCGLTFYLKNGKKQDVDLSQKSEQVKALRDDIQQAMSNHSPK